MHHERLTSWAVLLQILEHGPVTAIMKVQPTQTFATRLQTRTGVELATIRHNLYHILEPKVHAGMLSGDWAGYPTAVYRSIRDTSHYVGPHGKFTPS